jgi:hypothetical protein
LIDEFEKLIQIHDSYGAFRRLAAKKIRCPRDQSHNKRNK